MTMKVLENKFVEAARKRCKRRQRNMCEYEMEGFIFFCFASECPLKCIQVVRVTYPIFLYI